MFLQRHMAKHNSPPKYMCDICGQKSRKREQLIMHIFRLHVPARADIKCSYCGKW